MTPDFEIITIEQTDPRYPWVFRALGNEMPSRIYACGNIELLRHTKMMAIIGARKAIERTFEAADEFESNDYIHCQQFEPRMRYGGLGTENCHYSDRIGHGPWKYVMYANPETRRFVTVGTTVRHKSYLFPSDCVRASTGSASQSDRSGTSSHEKYGNACCGFCSQMWENDSCLSLRHL